MKKLIDGKFFDTDNKSVWIHTADILPEEAIDPLGDDAVLYGTEALYRSGKGQFFLSGTISYFSGFPGEPTGRLLSREEARDWLEQNDAPADAYEYAGFKIQEG